MKGKLVSFLENAVSYVEQVVVKDGVICDVYSFDGDSTRDLGVVTVEKDCKTPLQLVLKGDKTVEGFMSGKGILTVNEQVYVFPNKDNDKVEINIGDTMQWEAEEKLVFYEICYPPYSDDRFENRDKVF